MPAKDPDITPKMLLEHMQKMGQTLHQEIRGVKEELRQEIRGVEERLTNRIDRVERNLTRQIDGIDKRLDEIEIEELPRRVVALERKVGR